MSTEHRLHISGLTAAISPADLKERFQRYGNVKAVDTVGPDALGQPRNFVYLTIDAEQQSLAKCINSMQNSIWRGAKLKIAPAKKSYEDRLATERLTDIGRKALLNEKEARKLRIKERKDRKRRLAKAGGGRQSGDMRLMTEENWKNEGDIWRGKYWHVTPTHHLIRPIYTRPTHPIHMKPVSTALEKVDPLPTTKTTNQFEELGTLGKKAKKPRSLPPKRATRMLLDPFRYGHMHLNGAILEGAGTADVPSLPEGRWSFTYDDLRLDEISSRLDPSLVGGTWTFHPAGGEDEVVSSGEQTSANVEVVQGKRKRVADQLNEIAGNSAFSDTVQDVVSKHVIKKSRTEQSGVKGNKASFEDPHVLRLDDDDIYTLDDDDIWGTAPVTMENESVSLFDSNSATTGAMGKLKPPTKLVPVIAASSDEEDPALSDVEFDDDVDALFGASSTDVAAPTSPLFDKKASRIQAGPPSEVMSDEDSADETTRGLSTGVGMTLGGFAQAEKEKGLSVLQKLGINLSKEDESPQSDALKAVAFDENEDRGQNVPQISTKVASLAWLYDDEDDDDEPIEMNRAAALRLRGGAQEEPISDDDSSSSESSSDSHVDVDDALLPELATEQIGSRHALDSAHAPFKTAGNGNMPKSKTTASSASTSESSNDSSSESDDSSENEGNEQQSSGNGNGGQGNSGGREDGDDSDSDSGSDSDDSSSSDDEDDEEEAKGKRKPTRQNIKPEKQSLKDMFAAQPEATTGFSLMAGLDLELDSDLEMDEANPFEAAAPATREAESTLTSFAPVPAVDVNAVFNASSLNEPFFFGTTGRPLARTEDLQDGWMSKITVGGLEKQEVDVEPFWQTKTDEQMTQLWNEQKRELTKEYKKRHREAVKRQKRGMGGAGPSADGGGAMDVE